MVETWMPTLVPNVAARRWRTQHLMISSGDVVHAVTGKNKYGSTSDFSNEASVEQFFVARLLDDLGYVDAQIRPKASLKELTLHLGRKTVNWRPDFALTVDDRIRWIVEAKAPTESLEDWEGQASSYCLELNKAHEDNPVEFFLLTNGLTSRVYRWDQGKFVLEAAFEDFVDGNPRFSHMRELLAPDALRAQSTVPVERHTLRRHSVDKLNADFAWAHRTIFRAEALSYTAAFMEFVKIIFLKLQSDHDAHNNPAFQQDDVDAGSVPRGDVRFSVHWIERYEAEGIVSPLDELYFKSLSKDFEAQIAESKMKRIFEPGEGIKLSADTIKNLVGRFEHIDLRSIDADLNGRMFETFLNAALRGKDLGQFFTPRSVVKLATALADLRVDGDTPTRVMDACCGTGGFLIEALSVMNEKVEALPLGALGKIELRKKVQRSIIGVDVARDPALARIARINMYLHGDADSHIYQLDALDKKVAVLNNDIDEIRREKKEFAALLRDGKKVDDDGRPHGVVDVVLSNPPFAKEYSRREKSEARLLDEYELASRVAGGKSVKLQKLSSMVMFLERYYDLLAPGGTLVTVLDDGILGARKNAFVREWIQRKWLIKAVVSLPGDAFQRSQARVKTSILVLEKKKDLDETQPNVFMYYCGRVGVDDSPRQRALPVDVLNRQKATDEIAAVVALWEAFKRGDAAAQPWTVRAEDLGDRLDVKANLIRSGEQVSVWEDAGLKVVTADTLLQPVAGSRSFIRADADGLATYLRVRYDGFCEAGDEFAPEEAAATKFTRVRAGDLVFSHINAVHGAVGVVPAELDGCVVTNEYSVCRAVDDADTPVVWTLLRSTQVRADLIALATGIGRTRVSWTEIQKLRVPWPAEELRQRIRDAFAEANAAEATARRLRREATAAAATELSLDPERAREVISAFKPPR